MGRKTKTVRAVNLLCNVSDLRGLMLSAAADLPCEAERWRKKYDREVAKLRRAVASFTPDDFANIQKTSPETLAALQKTVAEIEAHASLMT